MNNSDSSEFTFGETSEGEAVIEILRSALKELSFGEIILNIHNGRIVQVTRIEKVRVEKLNLPVSKAATVR